eukprot:c24379_g1_i1 orf=175-1176(+)
MDPQTEKRLAALIMEEAATLKMQADKEGVHVYLRKPQIRGRPNPQFLTATVRGVQQANRAVEVNAMWRIREKELKLERDYEQRKRRHRIAALNEMLDTGDVQPAVKTSHGYYGRHRRSLDGKSRPCSRHDADVDSRRSSDYKDRPSSSRDADVDSNDHYFNGHENSLIMRHASCATERCSESDFEHSCEIPEDLRDEGLNDQEIEQFLHSRAKRGRGAVGSRMDEPGPYPLLQSNQSFANADLEEDSWKVHIRGPTAGLLMDTSNDLTWEPDNRKDLGVAKNCEGSVKEVSKSRERQKHNRKKEKRQKKLKEKKKKKKKHKNEHISLTKRSEK